MRSHFMLTRGIAAACAATGAVAIPAAKSSAALVAADLATNPAYDDGWQAGDNGGFGLGPWNFDGTYNTPVGQLMDIFSHPNDIGRAWTLFNADAPPGPGSGTDIAQAGRAFIGALAVGDTVTAVIDNPTERRFFRGYTVKFNTGGGNTTFAGTPVSRFSVGTFEYFTNGKWFATGNDPTLFDLDTNHGLRLEFTLTSVDTFSFKMTPLNNPGIAFSSTGTLDGPAGAPIDWIEFELYNTDSDYYPSPSIAGGETDFYISSITVVPEPSTLALLGAATGTALLRRRRRDET